MILRFLWLVINYIILFIISQERVYILFEVSKIITKATLCLLALYSVTVASDYIEVSPAFEIT
jgi:hypothetical protein